jgi:hypothetical protein
VKEGVYSADQLRTNRASLFLYGGTANDRHDWALSVAEHFPDEGPLVLLSARPEAALPSYIRGVVMVPSAPSLGLPAQALLLRCLQQEERAKWILGMGEAPPQALDRGTLRPDLWYRLRIAQVDVGRPEVQAFLKQWRSRLKPSVPLAKVSRARSVPARPSPRSSRRSG